MLLRRVRFRGRFGGELGRGVETRLEDLLSCPELPFSELQVLGEGPDGPEERLESLSAIPRSTEHHVVAYTRPVAHFGAQDCVSALAAKFYFVALSSI